MKRLTEFGDLDYLPQLYHLYLRKYLVFYYLLFSYYKLWLPALERFILTTKSDVIVECCAGSGEPIQLLLQETQSKNLLQQHFVMTDLYPQHEFTQQIKKLGNSTLSYIEHSIDASNLPNSLAKPRLFINSFHHLSPELVTKVLKDSAKQQCPLLILEYARNSCLGYFMMLCGALGIFLTLPFVVRLKDFPIMALCTYIVPLFPLMMLWDGIVSCLHEYSVDTFKKLNNEHQFGFKISYETRRSILYPAGVTAITLIPKLR